MGDYYDCLITSVVFEDGVNHQIKLIKYLAGHLFYYLCKKFLK